jgi:hypothetical protein
MTESLIISLIGSILAGLLSWTRSHSLRWSVWHGVWGWLSVMYLVLRQWRQTQVASRCAQPATAPPRALIV